jgi:hypothetical protein
VRGLGTDVYVSVFRRFPQLIRQLNQRKLAISCLGFKEKMPHVVLPVEKGFHVVFIYGPLKIVCTVIHLLIYS